MTTPDPTNAERKRRGRLRKAGKLPPVRTCPQCGARILVERATLCRRCWDKTPEGLAALRAKVARHRARKKQSLAKPAR